MSIGPFRFKRPGAKMLLLSAVWVLLAAPVFYTLFARAGTLTPWTSTTDEGNYDLFPVISSDKVPPLVMLVMSRDEQLFNKAYTDYSDLHQGEPGDTGAIDSTYDDTFSYSGYFGPNLCYAYDGSVFKADNAATGTNSHSCSGEWSGNFLNWVTMTRLDIVRSVLYGGLRTTDTGGASAQTVLQRAAIPNDLHAWVKVYNGADVASYTPFAYDAANPVSFCNASIYNNNGVPSTGPLMRAARGNWSEWSATQDSQCNWHDTDGDANNAPKSAGLGSSEYTVSVDVCDETGSLPREPFCTAYTDSASKVVTYKPTGLLQQYGDEGRMRFGLMTGSWADPRSGGRLRRNIGLFAGNGNDTTKCVAGDEVKLSDGTFCNQGDTVEGIVNTLNRIELVGWQSDATGGHPGPGSGWRGDAAGDNCYAWGGRARNGNGGTWVMDNPGSGNRHCSAYGNPLSEIYAEAVRYIEGDGNAASPKFDSGDDTSYITGMPDHVAWKDPYRDPTTGGSPYCATCSILVLSTGLNSFDSDEIPNDTSGIVSPANVIADTDTLGDDEGISGNNYLIGRVLGKLTDNGTTSPTSLTLGASIDTNADLCTSKTVDKLSNAIGICPDVPSLEGSYGIAGMAFKAWTTDLRPDLAASQKRPANYINKVQTYAVALAESLPSFAINTGAGTINFSPLCQSNTDGGAQIAGANWSSCALGAAEVGTKTSIIGSKYVYGRPLLSDNSAGSFNFVWEDSTFGSDHDLDATDMITWCVGTACQYTTQTGTRKNLDGTPYNGYDICWRSDSPECAGGGKPTVAANEVLVRIETMSTAGGYAMLTGYNITGTTADGVKRIELAPGSFNSILTGQNDPPGGWYKPKVLSFTAGGNSVQPLKNPLFYAAKYGGFDDENGDGKPDTVTKADGSIEYEWDKVNNVTGAAGADGVPDNFFPVHNPSLLGKQLGNALNAILKRTGSGTAAAVVANSVNGQGLIYRALYQSLQSDASGNSVAWTGDLGTLWVDADGLLREDNNHNGKLDDYSTDLIAVFDTDSNDNAIFYECTPIDLATFIPANFEPFDPTNQARSGVSCTTKKPDQLEQVWDAQTQLNAFTNTQVLTQRTYASLANTGRYIFTWIDKNHNGVVDAGEQTKFEWAGNTDTCATGICGNVDASGMLGGNFGFLNARDPDDAHNIIDWVRGDGDPALKMRNRTLVNGGANTVYRLGDIVDSTPLVVGRPVEAYDVLYGDSSYATFRNVYRDRRQVVYAGANDGMLHAFNGGFYDAANHQLNLQGPTGSNTASASAHPLGSEIWAYIPGNLLAHLRWMTDPNYKHVFYVDGNPVATDAKVFADDSNASGPCGGAGAGTPCHPGGWGTIMVVPFRLGGGDISVPTTDGTGSYDPNNCPVPYDSSKHCQMQESYSAYVILDVTDPEQPPVVLGEVTPASDDGHGQSFTTSVPAFAVIRDPSSGNPDKFYLFVGSGPTIASQDKVTSSAPLRLYGYDLGCFTGQVTTGCGTPAKNAPIQSFDFSNAGAVAQGDQSFAGDLIASDFNLNDKTEAVYFGSVRDDQTSNPREYTGSLWKLAINEDEDSSKWKPELMYDAKLPISIRPTLGLNARGAPEVYVGTGRVWDNTDLTTTGQQQIIGMIDPDLLPSGDQQSDFALPLTSGANGDLLDVTAISVCGAVTGSCTSQGQVNGAPSGVNDFVGLLDVFDKAKANGGYAGFIEDLSAPGTTPSERVVSSQALLGGALITNTFIPGTDVCTDLGLGFEYALDYRTGTANPYSSQFGIGTNGTVNKSIGLGPGLPSAPSLHVNAGEQNSHTVKACTQTSTGAIICKNVTTESSVTSGEVSWREPLDK